MEILTILGTTDWPAL